MNRRTGQKIQPARSLSKPTLPDRILAPQPANAINGASGSRPLSKASHVELASNYNRRAAGFDNVPIATPGNNNPLPPPDYSPATPASSANTHSGSASQHVSHFLHHTSHGFRSGSLSIKPSAPEASLFMRDTLKVHDATHLAPAKSYVPLPLKSNDTNLKATCIDGSDSDTPLASVAASRITRHPLSSAGSERSDHSINFANSSNRIQNLDQFRSLSTSVAQPRPVVSMETTQLSLDRHDRPRR